MSKSKKHKKEKRIVHFSAKVKEAIKKEEKDSGCQCLDRQQEAFGITSQVEAAVDAAKNTASLNYVEMSSNENVNESSQEDILRASPSSSHTLNLALPAKHRVDHRLILRRNLRQIRNLNQPVSLKRLACQLQQVSLAQRVQAAMNQHPQVKARVLQLLLLALVNHLA